MASSNDKSGIVSICRARLRGLQTLVDREIWEPSHLRARTPRGRFVALLRVLVLTWQGLRRNRIPLQAAALTFYSLIGLGPLIAIGIMVSGFVIDRGDENLAVEALTRAIAFAAPQTALGVEETAEEGPAGLAPEVTELLNQFISAAQSGTVGVVGSLMLLVIGIQVLSSIEGSFNSLWGVTRGRHLGERIVAYWTFISLGAVLGAASVTLLTLRTLSALFERLPFGGEVLAIVLFLSPVITFCLVTFTLAVFFRFIPNTRVEWRPAFTGAFVVVVLLHLYNLLSFLYVQRVVDTRSLYGSVGVVVVLMIGLYVFWLLILLGGQITYAVQNADYLTNESAWQKISHRSREITALAILLLVGRQFRRGRGPLSASQLHQHLRIPNHILNASVERLCQLGFLRTVLPDDPESGRDHAYLPGRPLESVQLGEFKQAFETFGNDEGSDLLADVHPGMGAYIDGVIGLGNTPAAATTLADLVADEEAG